MGEHHHTHRLRSCTRLAPAGACPSVTTPSPVAFEEAPSRAPSRAGSSAERRGPFPGPRRSPMYAQHGQQLAGVSPVWRLMAPTTSQWQLRRREGGWEGSRRRNRDPRYTNRIRGEAVWASQHRMAKPDVIKGPFRRCGGCARKVAGLIWGDLYGCSLMPGHVLRGRRVGWDGRGRKAPVHCGEVSRGRSTGAIASRREGPNAKRRSSTCVLVWVALTAANPVLGPGRE